MNISEVIKNLEDIRDKHGDLKVFEIDDTIRYEVECLHVTEFRYYNEITNACETFLGVLIS
jgi:hypothetical protein